MFRRFGKPLPDSQAVLPEAHESLISPETVAYLPLTGLSFEEIPHLADPVPLLPEGQASLLVDVLDVTGIRQERPDKEINPPLFAEKLLEEPRGHGIAAHAGLFCEGLLCGRDHGNPYAKAENTGKTEK